MKENLNLIFSSSLTELCEVNSSFDSGILKICYPGVNDNKTCLAKKDIERCIQTMYNCPIVCNYDRETDSFGGHDVDLVKDSNGNLRLVNITTPVGLIPESSKWYWKEFEEKDGTKHEYLCADALLWKRQEAYKKIKKDGVTAHSMELHVKDGEMKDGIYHIKDFEFTAFALIGVEPCFEGSAIEVYSKTDFKRQLSEMINDLKESFALNIASNIDAKNNTDNYSTEGGKKHMDEKLEIIAKFGLTVEDLDFSIDELTVEELEEKLQSNTDDNNPEGKTSDTYALNSNLIDEIIRELDKNTIQRDWGECHQYILADFDTQAQEIYCWDVTDWLFYGFSYTCNGDNVVIDYESRKRKKYSIVDFNEGEQPSPFEQTFALLENKISDYASIKDNLDNATETINTLNTEIKELREYKLEVEKEKILTNFEDLSGIEEFESLRESSDIDIDSLEEKCFAIRGRHAENFKYSRDNKATKIKVEKSNLNDVEEPYGGLFVKFGTDTKN